MISSDVIFDAVSFTQNETKSSSALNLSVLNPTAKLFLDILFASTGNATVTITYEVCDTETGTFYNPDGDTTNQIIANLAKNTHRLLPIPSDSTKFRFHKYIKIKIEEDDVAAITSLTAKIVAVN